MVHYVLYNEEKSKIWSASEKKMISLIKFEILIWEIEAPLKKKYSGFCCCWKIEFQFWKNSTVYFSGFFFFMWWNNFEKKLVFMTLSFKKITIY